MSELVTVPAVPRGETLLALLRRIAEVMERVEQRGIKIHAGDTDCGEIVELLYAIHASRDWLLDREDWKPGGFVMVWKPLDKELVIHLPSLPANGVERVVLNGDPVAYEIASKDGAI